MKTKIIFQLVGFILAAFALVGCGKNDKTVVEKGGEAQNQKTQNSAAAMPQEPAKKSTADKSTPLDKYVLLTTDDKDRHFAYIWFSTGAKPKDDTELMNVFSPAYYNERDVFKKKEIEERDKPKIMSEIESHKAMRYFAIAGGVGGMVLGNYDFEKKGFPIGSMGECWNFKIITNSNVELNYRKNIVPCFMPVKDIEVAKKIEAIRASHRDHTEIFIYGYIEGGANGSLDITPTALRAVIKDGYGANGKVIADISNKE